MSKFLGGACAALGTWLLATHALADVGAEMAAETDVGAEMSAEAGGEAKAEGDAGGAAERQADGGGAAARPAVATDEFAAPSGHTGAGLSMSPAQKGRLWGELGLHTQSRVTAVSPMFGGGYKVIDKLELELVIPLVYASFDVGFVDDSSFNLGNLYFGANYLGGSGKLKFKAGGGFGFPTAGASDFADVFALASGAGIRGFQDYYLWVPETLSLNGIGRVEYGTKLVFTGDVSLSFYFPTGDAAGSDNELSLTLAPGIGYWLGDSSLLGGRVLVWYGSFGGDNAQLGLEPYFRQMFGDAFFNARFTLNIDEPAGFAFDEGGYWGLHLGGGLRF